MQFRTDLSLLSQIWPETCQLSVDVKPLLLMRRPGSRVIVEACDGSVSYRANGGRRSWPRLVPRQASNRPSELCAPLSSCLSLSLIVGRGLIYTGDKICAAAYTHKRTHTFLHTLHNTAGDQWCCDMCEIASLTVWLFIFIFMLKYWEIPYIPFINFPNSVSWYMHETHNKTHHVPVFA